MSTVTPTTVDNIGPLVKTVLVVSSCSYLIGFIADILLISWYFMQEQTTWALLTLSFTLLPLVLVQIVSLRWYFHDDSEGLTPLHLVPHVLAISYRQISLLVTQVRSKGRRNQYKNGSWQSFYAELNDIYMLQIVSVYIGDAFQVLLQCYIIACTGGYNILTVITAVTALLHVPWTVMCYTQVLRLACKPREYISLVGMFLIFCWRAAMFASRILTLLLFLAAFGCWIFLLIGMRWLCMFKWLSLQNTAFTSSYTEERLFHVLVACIYLFTFINVADGQTASRAFLYYTASFAESFLVYMLWVFCEDEKLWPDYAVAAVVFGLYVVGLVLMGVYYRCYHPSGAIYILTSRRTIEISEPDVIDAHRREQDLVVPDESTEIQVTFQQSAHVEQRHEVMSIDMGYSSDIGASASREHTGVPLRYYADQSAGYTIDTSLR